MEITRLLTFATTFDVMQAEKHLHSHKLIARLRPTPRGLPSKCGLCLEIGDQDPAMTIASLRNVEIIVDGMAIKKGSSFEPVPLPDLANGSDTTPTP